MKVTAVLVLALTSVSAGPLSSLKPVHPRDRTIGQSIESRIIGGDFASKGQIPYQLAINFKVGNSGWFCGGSIISSLWALTAAHCTNGADSATIYAGSIIRNDGVKSDVTSKNFKQHPNYDDTKLVNDISLIQLTKAFDFSENIKKIGLPALTGPYDTYEGQKVIVSGWGLTDDYAITQPWRLRFAEVTVISNYKCNETYVNLIQSSHMCTAVTGGKATCYGDSGGPLTINLGSTGRIQIGIVSFGSSLGCDDAPNGFTRLTYFRDWIFQISGV